MEPSAPLVSSPSGGSAKPAKNDKNGATGSTSGQNQGQHLKSAILNNPQTEKIARGAVSRLGRFLLTKCATKKNQPGASEEDDEYFLADDLMRPDDATRAMLAKFDKQIKARVADLGLPIPSKLVFIGYKTQQVSGTDYFFKVKASNSGQYFHVRIYESLQHEFLVQDVVGPKFNADQMEILN